LQNRPLDLFGSRWFPLQTIVGACMKRRATRLAKAVAGIDGRAAGRFLLVGLVICHILTVAPSHAQRRSEARQSEDWVLLGSQEVDRTRNRERIDVRSARGRVKAVRLIAKGNELELSQIKVTYADGRVHNESRSINMNPNDRTRPIETGGTETFIDEIELVIQPARGVRGADRTMTMEVWGLQTSSGARAERPAQASQSSAAAVATPTPVAALPPPAPALSPPPIPTPAQQAALPAPQQEPRQAAPALQTQPAPSATTAQPTTPQLPTRPPTPAPVAPTAEVPKPPVLSPSPVIAAPPVVTGQPGMAPPLPPPRGPQDRVAVLQRAPTPVPVLQPGIGDEASDGIFLGRRTVNPAADNDSVPVGFEIGRLTKVRLRVLDAGLRVNDVKIRYGSGQPDVVAMNTDVTANSRTVWLQVSPDRVVRDVEISYRSRDGARSAATVEIYGEHADGYLDPGGDGARLARYSGWVPLGAKTSALRIGFDQLDFQIGRNKGGFKKLRVDAKDRAITLREVRVVYATGEDEIFTIDSTRQRIAAGASFGPIDLRGSSRPIKSLILKTRSRFLDSETRGKDAAIVEVWGQH
jgi:hypothetical protein